jgi:hypothetical protein
MTNRLRHRFARWLIGDLLDAHTTDTDTKLATLTKAIRNDVTLGVVRHQALVEHVAPVMGKTRGPWLKRLEERINRMVEAHNAKARAARGEGTEERAPTGERA